LLWAYYIRLSGSYCKRGPVACAIMGVCLKRTIPVIDCLKTIKRIRLIGNRCSERGKRGEEEESNDYRVCVRPEVFSVRGMLVVVHWVPPSIIHNCEAKMQRE